MGLARKLLIWASVVLLVAIPLALAATSPLLAWRDVVYIAAGFAGVVGLALLLVQPVLVGGYLPGLGGLSGRRVHRVTGAILVFVVALHVAGLWITSPPDVLDALLFRSPTPFAPWGVVAMWAIFLAAVLAILRRKLRLRVWRIGHTVLVAVVVTGSVVHALLIEGTMETVSKTVLSAVVLVVTAKTIHDLRAWGQPAKR